MKKLILVVALSLAAAVCACAQDLSVLSKAARMAYNWLAEEGYKPSIDEDNDVAFKVQGEYFYIDNDTDDPTLLRFLVPNVYEVDFSDEDQVMNALPNAPRKASATCRRKHPSSARCRSRTTLCP